MKKIRFLAAILAVCMCLSLASPFAFADGDVSYEKVDYSQATSLPIGSPVSVTGVANYGAYTSNDSTTLLAIDTPDGTWFAAIGLYSVDAFKTMVSSCSVTFNGVYAGTLDLNGMPIIDVQGGRMAYSDESSASSNPYVYSPTIVIGDVSEILSVGQEKVDEAAAKAAEEAKAKAEAEAAAKAAEQPQWKKTGRMVWIPTHGGHCYHTKPYCSGMIDPEKVDLGYAKYMGFRACKKC